ncbi:MAG: hypothetical protein ABEJ31_11635 [Haloarculaceae archaeon]
MNGDTEVVDDRIADAILSGSTYERLRVQHAGFLTAPIPTKLALLSGLLAALVPFGPLSALYPSVQRGLPAAPLAATATGPTTLGFVGVVVVLVAAALLGGVAAVRLGARSLGERRARLLLNLEDLAAFLGVGTGGLAVGVTAAYGLFGLFGVEAATDTLPAGGAAATGGALSVATLSTVALAGALAVAAAAALARRRLGAAGR